MTLMGVLGVVLVAGIVLTVKWGGTAYEPWAPADGLEEPEADSRMPSLKGPARRYLRGVAVMLVGGFWAGVLVTGPAVRLIMRLLAVTAGDAAQGGITEAKEVVGQINFGGTMALIVFGGILPGLASAAIYVVFRRWLPPGRLGGVAFGVLHLLVGATRIDPLRADNSDFDLVGPGWLAVATFALTAVLHGMAVVAIANRYSTRFPPATSARRERVLSIGPLVLPALFLVPTAPLLIPIFVGFIIAVLVSGNDAVANPKLVRAGRVAVGVVVLVLLPGTVSALSDIITA